MAAGSCAESSPSSVAPRRPNAPRSLARRPSRISCGSNCRRRRCPRPNRRASSWCSRSGTAAQAPSRFAPRTTIAPTSRSRSAVRPSSSPSLIASGRWRSASQRPSLKPGATYRIRMERLAYGHRGDAVRAYWVRPGTYTVTGHWRPRAGPRPLVRRSTRKVSPRSRSSATTSRSRSSRATPPIPQAVSGQRLKTSPLPGEFAFHVRRSASRDRAHIPGSSCTPAIRIGCTPHLAANACMPWRCRSYYLGEGHLGRMTPDSTSPSTWARRQRLSSDIISKMRAPPESG